MVLVHLPGNTKGENRCTEKNPNSLKDNRGNKGKKKKKIIFFSWKEFEVKFKYCKVILSSQLIVTAEEINVLSWTKYIEV